MKNNILNLKFLLAAMFVLGAILTFQSCEDDDKLVLPATCFDGAMNGDETGVDCGGSCQPCPTCTDGIMNGNETGVDCGGPDCEACPETCDDGILNNGEEEIDCGGPNCEPCAEPVETAIVRHYNYLSLENPMFHTFEQSDLSVGVIDGDEGNDVTTQGADLPMITFGVPDPEDASQLVGRYNRPTGLISDGFSDYKFEELESGTYDFSTLNQFELSVYIPNESLTGSVVQTIELIFLDATNPTFWETWTILTATASGTDQWETFTFDGSGMASTTIYNQIAIRIGGSNHTDGATFYLKDFAVQDKNVIMSALFNNDQGFNLDLTSEEGNDVTTQGADLPMMQFGIVGPENGFVGKYNRPEGLISDGFSDYKFAVNETKYAWDASTGFSIDIYTPTESIAGNVTPTIEVIILDRDNPAFWETWTILQGVLAERDTWETITFDGSALAGSDIYDQIAIRIGGSNHTDSATFYVRNFNAFTE